MMKKRKTNVVRFRYRGALARPLGAGESLKSKIPLLLADLGVTNKDEGFDKLAERHVPGCQRGKAGGGKRRLDPSTLAQFFESVDDVFHAAAIEGRRKPSIASAVEAVLATLDPGHPIRSYSKETLITYYKNQDEIELTYQRALEESLK